MDFTDSGQKVKRLSSGLAVTTFPLPPSTLHLVDATDSELTYYGLPRRPSPEKEPHLYAKWRKTFERPMTFIIPKFDETRKVQHQPYVPSPVNSEFSANWSGAVVFAQPGSLINGAVIAEWFVPNPTNVDGNEDFCSIWVGIDGAVDGDHADLANNLVQAGTETEIDGSGARNCYAWWEWLSDSVPAGEVKIPNLPVIAGNYFEAQIWVMSETTANLYMFTDAGPSGLITVLMGISAPETVKLIGGSAEWIVERPLVNGQFATLANFGSVEFSSALAASGSLLTTFYAGSGTALTMQDPKTGAILSVGKIISNEILTCQYG